MDIHLTEQEQIEEIKKWWKENGRSVVVGVVLGVAAVGGYRYWSYQQAQTAIAASQVYAMMDRAVDTGKSGEVLDHGAKLIAEYPGTPYAVMAALAMAKQRVESDELDAAEKHLQWAMDNASTNEFQHIARIRLARVMLAKGQPDAVLRLVADVAAGSFAPAYDEVKGDAYVELGRAEEARTAYEAALPASTGNSQQLIQLKLDNLGVPAQAKPEAAVVK